MARKLRLQFPGAIYHVLSRGDRRELIFRDDTDRESFLNALAEVCLKSAWQIHAFCLMPNHFHLIVETPQPNLAAGMKWFLGTYTARFNRRHRLTGHVFAGRYKSLLVGGEGGYLRTACDYVHLNPVRAKMVAPDAALRSYRWSSFPLYLQPFPSRPSWLRADRLLGECGLQQDNTASRREFEQRLEARRAHETDAEFAPVRTGWCFASDAVRHELLSHIEGKAGDWHYGADVQEAAEAKANRVVAEELRRAVWTEAELAQRKKGDSGKLIIARRLRQETTMTLQWIADRLHMGTRSHLSHLLYWLRRAEREHQTSQAAKEAAQKSPRNRPVKGALAGPKRSAAVPTKRAEVVSQSPGPSTPEAVHLAALAKQSTIPLTDPLAFDPAFD
jgi:REP element-mobilizing transposase RayT